MSEQKREQCPDCPDGQVWNKNGPTNEICPTCKGTAFIWVNVEQEAMTPTREQDQEGPQVLAGL